MRLLGIVVLALTLLAGCSMEPSSVTSAATGDAPRDSLVTSLKADVSLPFDDAGSLKLLGECQGNAGTGTPFELSRFDLVLPVTIDGVAAEVTFPLRVDDSSTMLDDTGASLSRQEQYRVLSRGTYDDCSWAATARRLGGGLLGLELAVVHCDESPPSADTSSLQSLTLERVLPLRAGGTFDLTGSTTGSEASAESTQAPMKLDALDFELPMTIDGVDVDVTFRVVVNDETRMVDEKGEVVPRLEHSDYEDSDFRSWVATVRKHGDELVAVELRVLAPGA